MLKKSGYVYVARERHGDIKVGKSIDFQKRMRQFDRVLHGIQVVALIKSDDYGMLEKFIHKELKDLEIWNEWYKNEKEVLRRIVDFMKSHGQLFGAYEIFFTSPKSQGLV